MVRHYKKKSSRGEWSKESMASALENVKVGRMSCLAAANAFNVPEATLRRRLKKDENVRINNIIFNRLKAKYYFEPSN